MDSTRPSFAITIESIKKSFIDAKNRGVKLRYLTEITDANISYCKELMSIVDEVRHLDGIRGNFMLSEIEYLAPATSHQEAKLAALITYSSVKEIVEHQQYMFDRRHETDFDIDIDSKYLLTQFKSVHMWHVNVN